MIWTLSINCSTNAKNRCKSGDWGRGSGRARGGCRGVLVLAKNIAIVIIFVAISIATFNIVYQYVVFMFIFNEDVHIVFTQIIKYS